MHNTNSSEPKFLFYSPVGAGAEPLLRDLISRMIDAGGDVVLAVYDGWVPEDMFFYQPNVRIVYEQGRRKWQVARKHFHPMEMSAYDYFFLWDDDLSISDFNPAVFLEIMRQNDLYIAQPSILSPYELTHPITRQVSCGKVLPNGRRTVGRFTNFVEIMAPVYSRRAWELMYPYLDDQNPEAFGYDYVPLGARGIVDCMHVVHTRPTRFKEEEAFNNMMIFYQHNGFHAYDLCEMGALTLAGQPNTSDSGV